MKAILFHQRDSTEVLQYGDSPTTEPKPGDVQVHLKATVLNRAGFWVRKDGIGVKLSHLYIPGVDGADLVDDVGKGLKEWSTIRENKFEDWQLNGS